MNRETPDPDIEKVLLMKNKRVSEIFEAEMKKNIDEYELTKSKLLENIVKEGGEFNKDIDKRVVEI